MRNNSEELVRKCYLEILKREPDELGINYYLNQLKDGKISPADLPQIFKDSKEYKQLQQNAKMKFSEIPILMYHDIRDLNNPWCVSQKEFCRQMGLLKRQDYKTISLAKLKRGIENNEETNEKLVVITFDDGREGVYSNAYPILRDSGFRATLYVVPAWIEGKAIPLETQFSAFMSWENLKELSNHGFDIGSHTFSHQWLVKLENEALKKELDLADKAIKDNLGFDVKHFCYPYGSFNEQIRELVVSRYDTAVATTRNFSKIPGAYSRQWVLNDTSLDQFRTLLTVV